MNSRPTNRLAGAGVTGRSSRLIAERPGSTGLFDRGRIHEGVKPEWCRGSRIGLRRRHPESGSADWIIFFACLWGGRSPNEWEKGQFVKFANGSARSPAFVEY